MNTSKSYLPLVITSWVCLHQLLTHLVTQGSNLLLLVLHHSFSERLPLVFEEGTTIEVKVIVPILDELVVVGGGLAFEVLGISFEDDFTLLLVDDSQLGEALHAICYRCVVWLEAEKVDAFNSSRHTDRNASPFQNKIVVRVIANLRCGS